MQRVADLPKVEQRSIRECLRYVLESGDLEREFETRIGVMEGDVRALLEAWPHVGDETDGSLASLAISNALNEVCHGVTVKEWDRWFSVSPAVIGVAYARWRVARVPRTRGGR